MTTYKKLKLPNIPNIDNVKTKKDTILKVKQIQHDLNNLMFNRIYNLGQFARDCGYKNVSSFVKICDDLYNDLNIKRHELIEKFKIKIEDLV